jgi:hypothetical protein
MAMLARLALVAVLATAASNAEPRPLTGVPLTGPTGLRLLVSANPPLFLDVDTGRVAPVTGLDVRGDPVTSVLAVGEDAVVWLARSGGGTVPAAELYVVRHGSTAARRIGTGWDVAPAADGRAIWVKRYRSARRCILAELGLDGRLRRAPRALPCTTRLVAAGSVPLLVRGGTVSDPLGTRLPATPGRVLTVVEGVVLSSAGLHGPLTLTDLGSGARRRLPWPSEIGGPDSQGGTDDAAVHGSLIALGFADPAYEGDGTQVIDVWLLDPARASFQHVPDLPAAVSLKSTSMSWTSDGRLVMLAESGGHDVVAVWRPGRERIAVRRVRLPIRSNGSDTFVAWLKPA